MAQLSTASVVIFTFVSHINFPFESLISSGVTQQILPFQYDFTSIDGVAPFNTENICFTGFFIDVKLSDAIVTLSPHASNE
jgi:hypothetical protein